MTMEYYINYATVKRYERQRKSRAKNPKTPYTTYETITIDLGNKSEFKHGQQVVVISKEDYANMTHEMEQLKSQNQQLQDNAKVDPTQSDAINDDVTNHVTNEDIHQQLLAMDSDHIQLVNVQNELNQYKSMAIDWNGALIGIETGINKLIDEVINATKKQYDIVIDQTMEDNQRALQSLLKTIDDIHRDNLEAYHKNNIAIAGAIDQTVEDANNQIRNTSMWQMIRHKKDINLNVPTSDLMQPPGNIKELDIINNAKVMEKLQSKPNFGNVDIMEIKQNLVNVPRLEELTVKAKPKK